MTNNKNVNRKEKYNHTILFFRLLAIVCILLCHIGTEINNNVIAQFFDVGVYFFLFISGYLYANKPIKKPINWLVSRYYRISVPCIIYVFVCVVISIMMDWKFSITSLLLYVINFEGYYHIFEFLPRVTLVTGTQHLWFITAIFICYFIAIPMKKYNSIIGQLMNKKIFLLAVVVLSFLLAYAGIRADYILTFCIGYYIAFTSIPTDRKNVLISMISMLMFITFRLLMKRYCDNQGDNALYTQIIIPLAYISITIFSYFFLDYLVKRIRRNRTFKKVVASALIMRMDELSFYIYVSHYILLKKELSVFNKGNNLILAVLAFILEAVAAGLLLEQVSKLMSVRRKKMAY